MPYQYPPETACPLCAQLGSKDREDTTIFATPHAAALVPRPMRARGAFVVVPRRHVRSSFELDRDEEAELMSVLHRSLHALERALSPDGVNVWWATGVLADQPIEHTMIEVVPRWSDRPYRYVDWSEVGEAALADREETSRVLREALEA